MKFTLWFTVFHGHNLSAEVKNEASVLCGMKVRQPCRLLTVDVRKVLLTSLATYFWVVSLKELPKAYIKIAVD